MGLFWCLTLCVSVCVCVCGIYYAYCLYAVSIILINSNLRFFFCYEFCFEFCVSVWCLQRKATGDTIGPYTAPQRTLLGQPVMEAMWIEIKPSYDEGISRIRFGFGFNVQDEELVWVLFFVCFIFGVCVCVCLC